GGTEIVVFTHFATGTDQVDVTGLFVAGAGEKAADALIRAMRVIKGADKELGLLGKSLPGVITGAGRSANRPVGVGPALGDDDEEEEHLELTGAEGLMMMLEFPDGTTLL